MMGETPVICRELFGRAPQLSVLRTLLDQACSGRGQVALLSGEAGIGKSRLVAELKEQASTSGVPTLEGRCFESDRIRPYAPLLDLLRSVLSGQAVNSVGEHIQPVADALLPLLPELHRARGGGQRSSAHPPNHDAQQVCEALVQLIVGRATIHPQLVVVEDLHWSDAATLEVLRTLIRRSAHLPLLLVLSYRSDEASPALTELLAELSRLRAATELALPPLTRDAVDAMLQSLFKLRGPVRPAFLDALVAFTEGNPFFIEEVLGALVTAGDISDADGAWDRTPLATLRVPRSIQAAVQRRLDPLSPAARELVAIAAVAGRRFEFALLERLTRHDEAALIRLIRELVRAQLVVEESLEVFAFRHALTQQAVAADMLARERRALHQQITVGLEQLAAPEPETRAAELAYHAYAAEDWARALRYATHAGQQALDLYAPQAAAEHDTHAIDAAQRLKLPVPVELYHHRGRAYALSGAFDAARADYEQALRGADPDSPSGLQWQYLLDLGFLWHARDFNRAGDYFVQALALAEAGADARQLAQSLNRLGNWHVNADDPLRGAGYHAQALPLYERAGDARGQAETRDLLAGAAYLAGDAPAAMAHYAQAAAQFRALDERIGLASSLSWLALCGPVALNPAPATAPLPVCVARAEEALQLARATRWRAGEAFALVVLGLCRSAQGEYGPALRSLRTGLDLAQELRHLQWQAAAHLGLGLLYLDMLLTDRAVGELEHALDAAGQAQTPFSVRLQVAMLAQAAAQHGALVRAEHLLDTTFGDEIRGAARTLTQQLADTARAELALRRDQPSAALLLTELIVPDAGSVEEARLPAPRLLLLRGRAHAAQGQDGEAETALLSARAGAAQVGSHALVWQIDIALGHLYQRALRRRDAARAFAAARTLVESLAANIPDPDLAAALLRQVSTRLPRVAPPSPRRAAREALAGLTRREREVAILVAQGHSNREIAASLVMTERTSKAHVSSILSKLGLSSRSQIVAWVIARGLRDGPAEEA